MTLTIRNLTSMTTTFDVKDFTVFLMALFTPLIKKLN